MLSLKKLKTFWLKVTTIIQTVWVLQHENLEFVCEFLKFEQDILLSVITQVIDKETQLGIKVNMVIYSSEKKKQPKKKWLVIFSLMTRSSFKIWFLKYDQVLNCTLQCD